MDDFEERYFTLHRNMLVLLGCWHTQSYRERLARYFILGFVTLYSIPSQLCQLFTLDFDLRSIVPLLQTFIPAICFMLLYFASVVHHGTIQKLYKYMKQDWRGLKDESELKIMEKYAYQSKLFTMICGVMFFLFVGFVILPPVLLKIFFSNSAKSANNRLPIFACISIFLDPETDYYPVLIHDVLIIVVILLVALACYSTYFWAVQHICAHLSIMKGQLHRPFVDSEYRNNVPAKPMDLCNWIIEAINMLSSFHARRFMNLVNALSEKCYLIQILLAFFLLVIDFICLFQLPTLLEEKETRKDAVMFTIYMFTTLFPIYVNCYVGQRLLDYSADVYEEACLIPIHEISLKTQKLLLTTLTLNAKPFAISIGKFFVSSHKFFSELLRTALSFAMVVHSMQQM